MPGSAESPRGNTDRWTQLPASLVPEGGRQSTFSGLADSGWDGKAQGGGAGDTGTAWEGSLQ